MNFELIAVGSIVGVFFGILSIEYSKKGVDWAVFIPMLLVPISLSILNLVAAGSVWP